ncbi:hypothetical protein, partial [Salmonella sp. s54395]|uniref:hypothetical protein n=1 Tax=Salmonella sp. s54395 TaxID=3159664 RepID=UPI00397FE1F7
MIYQHSLEELSSPRGSGELLFYRVRKLCYSNFPRQCLRNGRGIPTTGRRSWIYASLMDWMIWNIADPQTTNMNKANNHGPTGYFSSFALNVLGTFPLFSIFLSALSLALLIFCGAAILSNVF